MMAVVILAAGNSSRLGYPKQNVLYKGKTLLQHSVIAASAICDNVVVVTGASAEKIKPYLEDFKVQIIDNPNWRHGMATSIVAGLQFALKKFKDIDSVMFILCDQPFADSEVLQKINVIAARSDKGIVASRYNNDTGVPALFKKQYFQLLLSLSGNKGAKQTIKEYREDIESVFFPGGAVDIDTMQDIELLNRSNHHKN